MTRARTLLDRLLFWLRITDEDRVLSLTHAFLVVSVIVYWRHPDAITAATAAASVANYSAKNVLRRRDKAAEAPKTEGITAPLEALSSRVATVEKELTGFKSAAAIASLRR